MLIALELSLLVCVIVAQQVFIEPNPNEITVVSVMQDTHSFNNGLDWMGFSEPYDGVMQANQSFEIDQTNNPSFAIWFNISLPPYTTVEVFWGVNGIPLFSVTTRYVNNVSHTSTATTFFVISPCYLLSPLTLTAGITYLQTSSNVTGIIGAYVNPIATMLFQDPGSDAYIGDGVHTAYCCETYFYFNVSKLSDVVIKLSTVDSQDTLPFSTICIKSGSCPRNYNDSCVYWGSATGLYEFAIEAKQLKEGTYYVRIGTTVSQHYNITATRMLHHNDSDGSTHPYTIYVIIFSTLGGVLALVIFGVVVYMFKRKPAAYVELK